MNDRDTHKQEPAVKSPRLLIALAACAALLLPMAASAADPELKLPDFTSLRKNAVDFTDITIDGMLLRIMKKFAADDDEEAAQILTDIKSVRVRAFEFDSDDAYSPADVDTVRKQLSAPGWSAVVQQRSQFDRLAGCLAQIEIKIPRLWSRCLGNRRAGRCIPQVRAQAYVPQIACALELDEVVLAP